MLPAMAVLSSMALPTSAHAALVDTWAYTITSGFSNSTNDGGFGDFTATSTEIRWGANTMRSSIGAITPTSGTVQTNGDFEAANDYFHDNNTLPLGAVSLERTTLGVNIELTPTDQAGTPLSSSLGRSFQIDFFETPNAGTNGVCADGGAVGSGINSAGCADIFVLDFDFGQFDFTYDGEQYSAFLFEDPTTPQQLDFLSDEACASVGAGTGCFGFLTAENALTLAEFALSIEGSTDVPEPAALSLLGLGLLGIGAARRRKR